MTRLDDQAIKTFPLKTPFDIPGQLEQNCVDYISVQAVEATSLEISLKRNSYWLLVIYPNAVSNVTAATESMLHVRWRLGNTTVTVWDGAVS